MTAIAAVCTPEGFVIGADGRQTNMIRGVVSDKEQKIFGAEALGIRAAYGFAGVAQSRHFDMGIESKYAAQELQDKKFRSLTDYAMRFTETIYNSLVYRSEGLPLPPEMDYLACMLMVGYKGSDGEMVSIKFPYLKGRLQKPQLKCALEDPAIHFMMTGGYPEIYSAMLNQGLMKPCKTTTEGACLVEGFIGNCADHSNNFGNGIGGHTHIAKITPSESSWIVCPKP